MHKTLLAVLAGLLISGNALAQDGVPGDVNGDGEANAGDAVIVMRASVGLIELSELQKSRADVNGDGLVNTGDAVVQLRFVVGLLLKFPIPYPGDGDVKVFFPGPALYVGEWTRLPVQIRSGAPIQFEDLEFKLSDGPASGMVSLSKDRFFSPLAPHIVFGAGYRPGLHKLITIHTPSGTQVGEATFEITDIWKDNLKGPPLWFTGVTGEFKTGAAWGGGPAGPQNANVIPALGTRRIAILFVDTSSQRYPTDAATVQAFKDAWEDAVDDGVNDGGVIRSVRLFYEEVSYGAFSLTADVYGPVSLPGDFDTYFNSDGAPKGSYYQSAITAGDSLIDYTQYDTVLCVSEDVPASGGNPAKSAWPYASIGEWGPYTTAEGDVNLGVSSMPKDWEILDGRKIYQTFSHELGHNLGMGDLYTPSVAGRNVGGWDMMHADGQFPHFSLVHRMMLGWINPSWLTTFNFSALAIPVDQTTTLHPTELGAPPGGRSSGIEIRIADGWNYYFEYRNEQLAQIADQSLPTNNRILGTDVATLPFVSPILRPYVLLLNNDSDGDGPVLDNGDDYRETDFTDPVYPTDFSVGVSGIDGSKADIRVRYGVNSKPDPSIRPWPASPDRQWQSPDIEVQNARNLADPGQWFNVPWAGNNNTVIARVKNNGTLDAPNVVVNFSVKDFTVGGVPETFIGSDMDNIPAGATVEFTTNWVPPSSGDPHFCMTVRIPLYQVPGANPAVIEMTELNNVAQSNYTRFISATASPSSREITEVSVGNPYGEEALVYIIPGQDNPLYRTYIQHTWLRLQPGETRKVLVMYEYAGEDFLKNDGSTQVFERKRRVPNRVGLRGVIENPLDHPHHSLETLGGAEAEVVEGQRSFFEQFGRDGSTVFGQVLRIVNGITQPAPSGAIILTIGRKRDDRLVLINQIVQMNNGFFATSLAPGWESIQAYYLPPSGVGDATSHTLTP